MGRFRFTLATLMGAVALVAVGVAALRSPTALWASFVILVALGAICGATVGEILQAQGLGGGPGWASPSSAGPISS